MAAFSILMAWYFLFEIRPDGHYCHQNYGSESLEANEFKLGLSIDSFTPGQIAPKSKLPLGGYAKLTVSWKFLPISLYHY